VINDDIVYFPSHKKANVNLCFAKGEHGVCCGYIAPEGGICPNSGNPALLKEDIDDEADEKPSRSFLDKHTEEDDDDEDIGHRKKKFDHKKKYNKHKYQEEEEEEEDHRGKHREKNNGKHHGKNNGKNREKVQGEYREDHLEERRGEQPEEQPDEQPEEQREEPEEEPEEEEKRKVDPTQTQHFYTKPRANSKLASQASTTKTLIQKTIKKSLGSNVARN